MFSQEELARYSRHILLPGVGETGQKQLKAARVLIVGLGGLGSPAALYLAGAGLGKLGLVDDDRVSLSNLQRQVLYASPDAGQPKASQAQERLERLNPHVEIQIYPHKLDRTNARKIIGDYDLVLDGTDNFESRYVIARACTELHKPHLYAGLFRFEGQLALFEPGHACYACLFPSAPKQEDVPNCSEAGVLGPLAGIMGVLQALEALKFFLGLRSAENELVIFDGLSLRSETLEISRRADCPSCGKPTDGFWETTHALNQDVLTLSDRPVGAVILDVRSSAEIATTPVSTDETSIVVSIPLPELASRISELDRDRTYLTVCQSGKRSLRAQTILNDAGFPNVWNLRSGLSG